MISGKYDLTVETGPSFTTRREEAANQMIELIRAFPAAAPVLGDQLAKNLDWPGADIIAQRLAALVATQAPSAGASPVNGGGNLSQQVQKLSLQLQALQADRQIDANRLQVEMYRAQTDRSEGEQRDCTADELDRFAASERRGTVINHKFSIQIHEN